MENNDLTTTPSEMLHFVQHDVLEDNIPYDSPALPLHYL